MPAGVDACNYGGERPRFLCPGGGRRVGVLASAGKYFLCRHCYRLKYCSQWETDLDLAMRKVRDLKERLNRKGPHQRTRDRLRHRLNEAIERENDLFIMRFGLLLMRHA